MSTTCKKAYQITVGDTCQDAFTQSVDKATLVAWQNPAQFAFRYSMHLTAGQIVTFGLWSTASFTPAWYTSGGAALPDIGALGETTVTSVASNPNTYQVASFDCLTTGDYVLEVASPTNSANINRDSNTITSALDVITIASPIAHNGTGDFCAVHTFNWTSGDVIILLCMPQDPNAIFADIAVYSNTFVAQTTFVPDDPNFADSNNISFKVPTTGTYKVEVSVEAGDTGNVWFASGCGVQSKFSSDIVAPTVFPPFLPAAVNSSSGNISSQLWSSNSVELDTAKTLVNPITFTSGAYTLKLDVFRAGIRSSSTQTISYPYNYWKFDEPGPYSPGFHWLDALNGLVLSVIGTNVPVSIVGGLIGNGIFHDGLLTGTQGVTNLSIPVGYFTNQGISLSHWIKVNSFHTGDFTVILAFGTTTFEIRGNSVSTKSNVINGGITVASVSGATLATGSWHMIAMTFDPSTLTLRFYIDNALIGSSVSGVSPVFQFNASLGTQKTLFGDDAFTIDELAVWQEVLSVSDLNTLWNGGSGARPRGV